MTCPLQIVMIMHELKHEPKNLCTAQAVIPHATTLHMLTRRLVEPTPRDVRYVKKLFNLLCPTSCGYHDHLEKGGVVGPNMGTLCRTYELVTLAIFKHWAVRTKPEKLLYTF